MARDMQMTDAAVPAPSWLIRAVAAVAGLLPAAAGADVPLAAAPDLAGEARQQWEHLKGRLTPQNRAWFAKVAPQTYRREALILPEDRDGLDVLLRRTRALLADLRRCGAAGELEGLEAQLDRLAEEAGKIPPEVMAVPAAGPKRPPKPTLSLTSTDVDALLGELGPVGKPAQPGPGGRQVAGGEGRTRRDIFVEACGLRRRIAFANPLLDFKAILFAARVPVNGHCANVYYGFHSGGQPGGGIYVLQDAFGPEPTVRNLLAGRTVVNGRLEGRELLAGTFGWPDLSYDGKTVVFAYAEGKRDPSLPAYMGFCPTASFHLFTAAVDGGGIVQVTDGKWDDAHPCWLPNGRIAFMSTRRGGAARCGGPQTIHTLHSVNADGADLTCLSYHETHEWSPSVRGDGMIVYTRWDYVDRGDCIAHHPWVCFPDGRDPRAIHGNYPVSRSARPDVLGDLQEIPGSRKLVGTATGHHGPGFVGSLVILDANVEDDGAMAQLRRLTPGTPFPEVERGGGDYATAWPLSQDYFLCSSRGGLYLLDSFGNRELLYRAPPGCMDPVPLRRRPRPPVLPHGTLSGRPAARAAAAGAQAAGNGQATVACMNVYDSTMPWPAGTKIAALRIIQLFPKQHGTWMGLPEIGGTAESLARGVLGTVPVEADGSAYFTCPSGKCIYFQALDDQGRAVQSMQSATYLHPGERLVCQGCHERRARGPAAAGPAVLALRRAPSPIKAEADGSYPLLYPRLVQPVLDKHCVACHRQKNPKKDLSGEVVQLRAGRPSGPGVQWAGPGTWWSKSYMTLRGYGFGFSGKPPSRLPALTTPGRFGALASRLYPVLRSGHRDRLKLPPEDMRRIVLWLDCNSNFLGAYHDTEAQAHGKSVMPPLE